MKLQRSDVVRLATGGPWMTVSEIHDDETVSAIWFDGKDFKTERFHVSALSRPA